MWSGGGPVGGKRFLVILLLRKGRKSPGHDGRCCPPFVLFRLSPWTPFPTASTHSSVIYPALRLSLNNWVPALCLSDWVFPCPDDSSHTWLFLNIQHSDVSCSEAFPALSKKSHSAPLPHLAYFLHSLITTKIIQCAGWMPLFPYWKNTFSFSPLSWVPRIKYGLYGASSECTAGK